VGGLAMSEPIVDREIVVSRVIQGPRRLVFEAYTDVRHLSRWWGPDGFTTTTHAFEFRPGGVWEFTMHGPDGADAIRQYRNAGLVDEFSIALAAVVFGAGVRLLDGVDPGRVRFEIQEAIHSPMVTHLRYAVRAAETQERVA
jgi:Activator of Hsp90 ATPase homolog 1-like protein